MKIYPKNRYLLVKELKEEKEKGVGETIFVTSIEKPRCPWGVFQVLAVADDCEKIVKTDVCVLAPSSSIETLTIFGQEVVLLQERYVLAEIVNQ